VRAGRGQPVPAGPDQAGRRRTRRTWAVTIRLYNSAMPNPELVRGGEYAPRGDYHRTLDPSWDYYPTYLAKLAAVRGELNALPGGRRVLDAGCGEGVLVDEYAGRLEIRGVDAHYASARVTTGSLLALPCPDASFARALCLDVLEHLAYEDQPRAL